MTSAGKMGFDQHAGAPPVHGLYLRNCARWVEQHRADGGEAYCDAAEHADKWRVRNLQMPRTALMITRKSVTGPVWLH